jgi:hypothetical protein
VHHGSVQVARQQPWDEVHGVAFHHRHAQLRVQRVGEWQQRGDQPAAGGAQAAKTTVSLDHLIRGMDVGFDVLEFVDDASTALDDHGTFFGHFARVSIHQDHAEFLFEPGDVGRNVALHRFEVAGRCRKRAVLGDGDQAGQVADLHVGQASHA